MASTMTSTPTSALSLARTAPAAPAEATWQQAGWLPCRLAAEIAVRGFTLGDLLSLASGSLLDTGVSIDAALEVQVNGVRVGRAQLDASEQRLALRLSELA